jgi:hypothetical protein
MVENSCEEDIEKIQKTDRVYLIDFLSHMSYMSDKAYADDAQYKFEEDQRKLKKLH